MNTLGRAGGGGGGASASWVSREKVTFGFSSAGISSGSASNSGSAGSASSSMAAAVLAASSAVVGSGASSGSGSGAAAATTGRGAAAGAAATAAATGSATWARRRGAPTTAEAGGSSTTCPRFWLTRWMALTCLRIWATDSSYSRVRASISETVCSTSAVALEVWAARALTCPATAPLKSAPVRPVWAASWSMAAAVWRHFWARLVTRETTAPISRTFSASSAATWLV